MNAQQFFCFVWGHAREAQGTGLSDSYRNAASPREARGAFPALPAGRLFNPLPASHAHVNRKFGGLNKVIALSLMCGLLFVSCRTEKLPKDILTTEQLTQIMIEFYLAEAKLNNYSLSQDSAKKLFMPFEEATLKKYGVADSTLKKTYQYYFDHPTELEKIYEVVIDSLSLRERKATGLPRATLE